MPPLKGSPNLIQSITVADTLEHRDIYKTDDLVITIRFIKANPQTEQQAIDSLIRCTVRDFRYWRPPKALRSNLPGH